MLIIARTASVQTVVVN